MQETGGLQKGMKNSLLGLFEPLIFSFRFIKDKKPLILVVIISGLVSNLSLLFVPVFIGDSVSALESGKYALILRYTLLIFVAYGISAVVSFSLNYNSQYISQYYAMKLRTDFMNHLVRKKFLFFESQTSGDLLSRGTMDIEATRNFILNTFTSLIPTIFLIGEGLVLLYLESPFYSVLLILATPVLIFLGMISSKKQRPLWRMIRKTYGRLGEILQENIVGQRVIRGISAEEKEIKKYSLETQEYLDENYEVGKIRGLYNNLMPLTVAAISSTAIGVGGYFDMISKSSVGGLVAAVTIFSMLTNPVSFLGRMVVFSENSRAAIQRINEVISTGDEEDVDVKDFRLPPGPLELSGVSFSRGGRVILRNISFRVSPGDFVGITGRTGAGKSSLVNLIMRYYDPTSGRITISGIPIQDIPLSVLRRIIAMVPQEINLLSGTVKENILFGLEATDREVEEAAKIAEISDFISSLPQKYETLVGERGITLSGGQRQRIAIARAVIRKPSVLILDDATSSVDPDTEVRIFRNLKEKLKDSIILMISLRDSALSFADKVLILESGEMREGSS
ncbi:MAG: ABC transporter ATP-binding protein [Thermoplasmatales archaeon]